jgi:selenoprotein W-related protein
LTGKLLTTYKQKISNLVLIPSGGGCFEVSLDGELLYSKLKTKQFPDEKKMVEMIGSRLK